MFNFSKDKLFAKRKNVLVWLGKEDFPATEMMQEEAPNHTITPCKATDGLCREKDILLGVLGTPADTWRLLLHEVAHARLPHIPPPGHTSEWLLEYVRLICKWGMGVLPSHSDLIAYAVLEDIPLSFSNTLKGLVSKRPGKDND